MFDGAHNAAGAKALKNYLEKYHPKTPITIVFGTMRDKDLTEIAETLFPLAENLILTEPDNPRAMSVGELKQTALKYLNKDKIFSVPDVSEAVDSARQISSNYSATKHSLILVTGSLYLIGEAQKILSENQSQFLTD